MAGTASRKAAMVHHPCSECGCAGMAQIAVRIPARQKWNMRSVGIIDCAFDTIRAVMTGPAYTRSRSVMETGTQPGAGIQVADVA